MVCIESYCETGEETQKFLTFNYSKNQKVKFGQIEYQVISTIFLAIYLQNFVLKIRLLFSVYFDFR